MTSLGPVLSSSEWIVFYILYSPETYVVKYGTSQDTLTQNSSTIYSGNDMSITNMPYSVTLSNLKENTTYYVQVVATNTAQRSSVSSVEQFRTCPLMKKEAGTYIMYIDLTHKVVLAYYNGYIVL